MPRKIDMPILENLEEELMMLIQLLIPLGIATVNLFGPLATLSIRYLRFICTEDWFSSSIGTHMGMNDAQQVVHSHPSCCRRLN